MHLRALLFAAAVISSAFPSRAGYYDREKAWWSARLGASMESVDQDGFGSSAPSFENIGFETFRPGSLAMEASLEGVFFADLLSGPEEARFRILQGHLALRRGAFQIQGGRIFLSAALPAGYQDGGQVELTFLKRETLRFFGGRPSWAEGPFGLGRSWAADWAHRGRAWGGALNVDLGYYINSGQTRVWTGTETELQPFIRQESAGAVLSWSRYELGFSALASFDLLYRRFNEIRVGAHRRFRSRTTIRAEARLRGAALPGDSLFVTFAGAGTVWWQGALGADLALRKILIRADLGASPEKEAYWVETGVASPPSFRRGGLSASWGLSGRWDAGPGSQSLRLRPRLGLRGLAGHSLSLYGSLGRWELEGKPGQNGRWALGLNLGRKIGAGRLGLFGEGQAWRSARPDSRAGLSYSLGLGSGEGLSGWRDS